MYIFFSFLTGVLIVISMMLNGELSKKIGIVNSVVINYLTATISSLVLCFTMINPISSYSSISNIPLIYFLGGAIGVLTTYLFNVIVHKVSTVYTVILRFIGQMLTSAIIDYVYLNIFSIGTIVGCILFLIGIILNTKSDENYKQKQLKLLNN
ncbi:DMT family transporter [Clostridium tagluense]|uniref:DMT family transporter n=1 Tax=Clostridium tagluense TaxID=360422 RepID=UPI001CF29A96|nr:DMT family transporter [Clostridium tagluense]MCB2311305.1 DMT family transporter [Clostridium tagluense]MCB2316053.1 DMT family transporter [Clostridium tagluense]MCB2320881.1 DMT family transporter [Clostridium tagluense]MCB2325922.1 DMT family transporter [Clostridium tagluense]MCB2330621.1 DMT family transporter [Clostridium tagluense]